ncbi:MAG: glycoside hydrolase superfamily [Monoraphidium minutum]|nr:MAG: glycoside hydrolase superfamily [Monoraphidium minutum]
MRALGPSSSGGGGRRRRAALTSAVLWGGVFALAWVGAYLIINGSLESSAATGYHALAAAAGASGGGPRRRGGAEALLGVPAAPPPQRRLGQAFATLWASELAAGFNLSNTGPLPPQDARYDLGGTLDTLKRQGIDIVFTSFRWADQEPSPTALDFRLQDFVQREVCARGLQLAVVMDAQQTPGWVLERFPEAALVDAAGGRRHDVSFSHAGAGALAAAWQGAMLARMATVNAACVHSVQPSYNNEYETKYTQERDCFQDYSPAAGAAFRKHLAALNPDLSFWNARWAPDAAGGANFSSWAAVRPLPFFQHGKHYDDSYKSNHYWDFQAWRHAALHAAHEAACARAAGRGFRCILHFGEFFSSNDAIYASGAAFTLAASPYVDFVVVDSNFLTAAHTPNDVRIVQLLLAALKPFGKPVFFEGAFERISDPKLHARAVALTAAAGAAGVGFTNWLGNVDAAAFFQGALAGGGALAPAAGGAGRVALVAPHRSFQAFKGLPLGADGKLREDASQAELFECLDRIEAAGGGEGGAEGLAGGLEVFGVPAMLLPRLSDFERVWYLEPRVILSRDDAAIAALRARAAAAGVEVTVCGGRAAAPIVIEECCGGV